MTALILNAEQSAVINKTDATLESAYADGVIGVLPPLPPLTGYVQPKPVPNPPQQDIPIDTIKTMIKNPFKSTLSALLGALSSTPPLWVEITDLTGGFQALAPDGNKRGLFYSVDAFGYVNIRGALYGTSSGTQITSSIPSIIMPKYNRVFTGVAGAAVVVFNLVVSSPTSGFLNIVSSYSPGDFITFETRYFPGD